jgi:hypothetical protein
MTDPALPDTPDLPDPVQDTPAEPHQADWIIGPSPSFGAALCMKNPLILLGLMAAVGGIIADTQKLISYHIMLAVAGGGLIACGIGALFCLWKASSVTYLISPDRRAIFMESGLKGFQSRVRHTIPFNQIYDCDVVSSPFEQMLGVSSLVLKLMHNVVAKMHFIPQAETASDWINRNSAGAKARVIESV